MGTSINPIKICRDTTRVTIIPILGPKRWTGLRRTNLPRPATSITSKVTLIWGKCHLNL